jgi:spore coat polysaccharide biosynthesis protein SpsF
LRIVVIIQARMSSSRLPGKVLKDIAGKPMLVRVAERASRADLVDLVGIATTGNKSDDAIVELCHQQGYPVWRGSEFDVLDRFYQAAKSFQADVIVRLTADCPVIDPAVIDKTIQAFLDAGVDFAATRLPPPWKRTYPIGLDVEVCSLAGLERAWNEADQPYQREHVMPYFYDQEGRFRILILNNDKDYGSMRWTVDTQEDLVLIRHIFERFPGRDDFSWQEILDLFQREPELADVNAHVRHKVGKEVDHRMKSQ